MAGKTENPIASGSGPAPENDQPVAPGEISVITYILCCKDEAEQARNLRISQMDRNWRTYLGIQDFSHKQPGQSREFLPKVPVATEKLAAIVKRGMIQFGDFFNIQTDSELADKISGEQLRELLKAFLFDLWGPASTPQNLPTVVSDATKQCLHKNLFIFKVHGGEMVRREFTFDDVEEEPNVKEISEWHLRIDLVRPEDYYPDPTGNGMYEIHRVERDLFQILDGVKAGIYKKDIVDQLLSQDYPRPDDEKLSEQDRNQEETVTPSFRRRVVIDEFWGTILNNDGSIAHRNVVAAVANGKFLIRPPEPNPFWHQESPFIVAPLLRVPHSVWHKAVFDHASDLNLAINEMFNLIFDGGLAAVWGVRQLRLEDLEDPGQVANGIPQGATLVVKQTLPHNAKVLETVTEADIPKEALAMFDILNREFDEASMSNDASPGSMPPISSKTPAVAFLQGSQSQNMMLDGIIQDLETEVITRLLRLSFLTVLQNADYIPDKAFSSTFDKRVALMVMRASPAERFALFAGRAQFKVNGISSAMTKALDFQKMMALLQAMSLDPMLKQEFMMEYSPSKIITQFFRTLNLNSEDFKKSPEEMQQLSQTLARTNAANQMMQGGPKNSEGKPGGVASGPGTGGSSMTATIQQQANPGTGMPNM